jgi:hypothetical protein
VALCIPSGSNRFIRAVASAFALVVIAGVATCARGQNVTAPSGLAVGRDINNSTINIYPQSEGSNALLDLGIAISVVGGTAAAFVYKYYRGLLAHGASPKGSLEREDFERLRESLAGDNVATRFYSRSLSIFLDQVDCFFCDAALASRASFLPRFLRLRSAAPLWTGAALDRCLLIAFLYPIATIFLIWVISGVTGPAEDALALQSSVAVWRRGLAVAAVGCAFYFLWGTVKHASRFDRPPEANTFEVWAVACFGVACVQLAAFVIGSGKFGMVALAGIGASGLGLFYASRMGAATAGAITVSFATGFACVGTFLYAKDLSIATRAVIGGVVGTLASAGALAIGVAGSRAIRHGWHGLFLAVFLGALIIAFILTPNALALSSGWENFSRMVLFLGFVPLLNAPFDWFSVGLTRALLRRGLECGGLWPYVFGLIDASLAAIVITVLALVMVVCIQSFNEAARAAGGAEALSLSDLLNGIALNPTAPQYWWAYAVLFSTMTPSLINLGIGGISLMRGLPWLGRGLLRWIPEDRDVPEYRRPASAALITVQVLTGLALGLIAQFVLIWVIILHILPRFGLDLLDLARAVADFDVPARIRLLFAGALQIAFDPIQLSVLM